MEPLDFADLPDDALVLIDFSRVRSLRIIS
jgi:hypothetical protein